MDHSFQALIPFITTIIVWIFLLGKFFQKSKTFVTKPEVTKIVSEQLKEHCPYTNSMEQIKALEIWRHQFKEELVKDQNKLMLLMQEVKINTKVICEKLAVDYMEVNKS